MNLRRDRGLRNSGEAHKSHSQQTCRNQCDRNAFHGSRHIRTVELLAYTGKNNQSKCKADSYQHLPEKK